ncbi:MAG: hypothetical protein JJU13_02870 [Balneolaceae bacterium]|nr:hypothetical protein [Balneolaceae bacterium]
MKHSLMKLTGMLAIAGLIALGCDSSVTNHDVDSQSLLENEVAQEFSTSEVTPSTNEQNKENDWSHFVVDDVRVGEVDITFNQPRSFAACFEYRIDGEEPTYEQDNFNTDIDDGLWSFICLGDAYDRDTYQMTLEANEYVEIRMVFGAERDERFDWTRVGVLSDASSRMDCMNGVWEEFGFRNQGQCIRYVNTGQDSR